MIRCTAAIAALLALAGPTASAGQALLSTWLGGRGEDRLVAAAVLTDGAIILAGVMPGTHLDLRDPDKRRTPRATPPDGILVRLSPRAGRVMSVGRVQGPIGDMAVDDADGLFLTLAYGTSHFSPFFRCQWTARVGDEKARIATGPDGASAVLSNGSVTLLDKFGHKALAWKVPAHHVEDIAVDPVRKLIFVTGYNNRTGRVPGQRTNPVQVAFLYAYNADGKRVWRAYDWRGQDLASRRLMADTRGYRLAMGADGKLYLAGESAGGNTLWARQSQKLNATLPLARGDAFQSGHNTGANPITFVGRFDPETGRCEAGTLLLARLGNGKGNTIRPRALAADAQGVVYVGGLSASHPPVSKRAFAGDFEGGGAFLSVFDHSFARLYATKLCAGTTLAVAAGQGAVAVVGEGTEDLPGVRGLQPGVGGGTDGWVVVLPSKLGK